jgi:asparagine synthase (glutamine-hydrolysing)
MTIMAGIFSRSQACPIQDSACESIKRIISRNPHDEVITFRNERIFLAKIDINAYGQPAFRVDPSGSVSMLVGEPLLSLGDENPLRTRKEDLESLHHEWDLDNWDLLKKVRGEFCAAHYNPTTGKLALIADKLGIRLLYYWEGEKYIIFATALRIIEALAEVPKQMDLRAVTEMASLQMALSARTPYSRISVLKAAEIVKISDKGLSSSQYWRWDEIQRSNRPESELLREAYERFISAVKRRLRKDTTTFGALSGGLDTRCVISVLRSLDVVVHTFNFAPPGTQDQFFGAEFARSAGTIHEEIPLGCSVGDWWSTSKQRITWPPERPQLMWGGFGGSVGVGHVYVSSELVDLLRSGKRDTAIDVYLHDKAVLKKLLKPHIYNSVSGILKQGIREELDDIHCDDPGRAFHIFLMLNDQRRHLAWHFEGIDLHRLELHSPFYDSDFLQLILAIPIDICLGHRFYTKWLKHFPPVTTSVPWQAYPGHEPCPLPVKKGLGYQWDGTFDRDRERLRKLTLLQEAREMLSADKFPHPIINRMYLRLATWIYRMGLRDYSYVIQAANPYYRYWVSSGGDYVLPSRISLPQ